MRVETKPTMKWEDAPDTITPNDLAAILGIGIGGARAIFDKDDFPKISKRDIGNIGKADKEAARLYIQGVNIKTNSKEKGCKQEKIYSENNRINSIYINNYIDYFINKVCYSNARI